MIKKYFFKIIKIIDYIIELFDEIDKTTPKFINKINVSTGQDISILDPEKYKNSI